LKNFSFDDPTHTFVIAEAGSNWKAGTYEDDTLQAQKLIEIASKSGADAVKFQTFQSKSVYVPNAGNVGYLSNKENLKNINEIFEELSMPYEMIQQLEKTCKKHNIIFMSTPFSVEDAKHVDPYVRIHKVASFEINHIKLLEFLANTKKPVLISTGASTYEEIDFAVDLMRSENSGPIGLLQCTSKYPTSFDALNVSVIPKLKERYNVAVGLSDHSVDNLIAPLVAVGLGATIIEKHFTINRNMPGPDHSFSLNPQELFEMVDTIRKAERAKGDGNKVILNEERELKNFAKRSIQAIKSISEGDIFELGKNIDILRPGNRTRGAEPRFLSNIIGKKSNRVINISEGVQIKDCTNN